MFDYENKASFELIKKKVDMLRGSFVNYEILFFELWNTPREHITVQQQQAR